MISSFKSKHLEKCFTKGICTKIKPELVKRILQILDALNAATNLQDIKNIPGGRYHPHKGARKGLHTLDINNIWRVSFRLENGDAYDVDIEQYH